MPFFKRYPANVRGTDYVVGDLHGHRQQLLDALERNGFDRARDRLFCTGDLIDRGPDSFGSLMLILEPWFFFVKGNHEDDLSLFLQYLSLAPGGKDIARKSGQDWVYDLDVKTLGYLKSELLPRIENAPIVLNVEGDHGFWMVRADRATFGRYFDPLPLIDDEQLPFITDDDQLGALLWSRRLLKQVPRKDMTDRGLYLTASGSERAPGVGLTFVGHSYVEHPTLYRSHFFIDTGAGTIPDGKLTVLRVSDVIQECYK